MNDTMKAMQRSWIERLVRERMQLQRDGNAYGADRITRNLMNLGITVRETDDGVEWKYKRPYDQQRFERAATKILLAACIGVIILSSLPWGRL